MRDGLASARCTTTPACPTSSRCCSATGRPTWPTSPPTARWPTRRARSSTTRRARRTSCPASWPARSAPASRTSGSCASACSTRSACRRPEPRFDDAGTFVGSSYVYATALDYLRFGLLYLRDGVWDGKRLLPEGWVDHGRRIRSYDPDEDRWYGAHWWSVGDDLGTFWASGYEGQSLMLCPPLDLMVVRLGRSPDDHHNPELTAWRARMVDAFRGVGLRRPPWDASPATSAVAVPPLARAAGDAGHHPQGRATARRARLVRRRRRRHHPVQHRRRHGEGPGDPPHGAGGAVRAGRGAALRLRDRRGRGHGQRATCPSVRTWATRIGGRYLGADRAEEMGAATACPASCSSGSPRTRIVGETGVAD